MIRPAAFNFNEETAPTNVFQKRSGGEAEAAASLIQEQAILEFDNLVNLLRSEGVHVHVLEDDNQNTPDSIFPNNWFISFSGGNIFLSSMEANNRRLERRKFLADLLHINATERIELYDFSHFEKEGKFLEGTGVLILDRNERIAYASISSRCDATLVKRFCEHYAYTPITFHATHESTPIYHTNVMMALGNKMAHISLESIQDASERQATRDALERSGKEINELSTAQVASFAGNMLELRGHTSLTLMSETAFNSLSGAQRTRINRHSKIIQANIQTIERYGGGSVRCMVAEIFR